MTIYEHLCAQDPTWLIQLLGVSCAFCIHHTGLGCQRPIGSCHTGMLAFFNQPLENLPAPKIDRRTCLINQASTEKINSQIPTEKEKPYVLPTYDEPFNCDAQEESWL